MSTPERPDVVVIGGGAIGLAAAWRLAQRGLAVTLVDPAPGSGASTVAAGMLAPFTEARMGEDDLLRLNLASWSRWPDFAAEVEEAAGAPIGYRADGTLVVALDADDRAEIEEGIARQRALGLEVTTLRSREARALEPGLAPGVRGGALAAGERSVDTGALVEALQVAAAASGVRFVGARVGQIVCSPTGDRVTGVALAPTGGDTPPVPAPDRRSIARCSGAGWEASPVLAPDRRSMAPRSGAGSDGAGGGSGEVLEAPWVVLAAGCWSAGMAGLPDHARPPVRPVKGQVLTLRQPTDQPMLGRIVRGVVHGSGIYLVPRDDGRVVAGATVEERGWDTTITAGGAYELLRDALALVPGLDDAELVGVRAGLRPGTPDDLPLIGPSRIEGLVVATGHFRNGILLTPVTAEAVAAVVAGEPAPPEVAPCDPGRFAAGSGAAVTLTRENAPPAGAAPEVHR